QTVLFRSPWGSSTPSPSLRPSPPGYWCLRPGRSHGGGHNREVNPARQNVESQNAQAWDRLAREQAALARPARDEDFAHPLRTVDPLGWLEGSIAGKKVLCLAAGGGRQSALYAAAGADVAVLDISREMLLLDVQVAAERK